MKCMFTVRSLTGGGAERVVSVLANHLSKSGHEVYVVVYARTDKDYPLNDNVKVITMPQRKDSFITKILRINDMEKIIEEIKPDVIIPFVGTIVYVSWFASRKSKIPYILTVRNNPWLMPQSKNKRKVRDYIAKKSTAIMVQNEEQCDYFPKELKDKMFIINNPISETFIKNEKEKYTDDIKRIISVGRLDPQKNQKILIQAFAKVHKKKPDVKLEIYGEGPEKDSLAELIKTLKLEKSCFLMGRSINIEQVLCDSDLFVMTSNYEGMPNALMEAMAIGMPVLSSDCLTGPKSLIENNKDGILFETNNQQELENKLEWMITHPKEIANMGKIARKKMISKYTYNNIYSAVETMLKFVK